MDKNILLLFGTIFAILPIFFIKYYIKTKNYLYILLAICSYVLLCISYVQLFTDNPISNNYVALQLLQILLVLFGGFILYNEQLTKEQYLGVLLGTGAIYLLA
jgi:drug/metabolite transporter (DMT)-like permease